MVLRCARESSAVTRGVPQGSILGPTFFSLYFNDLYQESSSLVKSNVDDTEICFSFASKDIDSCLRQVAEDFQYAPVVLRQPSFD